MLLVWVKQWSHYLNLWPTEPVLGTTIVQYLIAFTRRPEGTSDVISGRFVGPHVPENRVKFGDLR